LAQDRARPLPRLGVANPWTGEWGFTVRRGTLENSLGGNGESQPEVQAIPENRPVESRARGSYAGAYLLGGVLAALLLWRLVFAS
jgi:hypothetical protein